MAEVRLGLIGDHIAASQAPRLHRLAGQLRGSAVRYDLLVPAEDRSRIRCPLRSLCARRVPRNQRHSSVQGTGGGAGRDREPPGTRDGRGEPGALRPGSAAGLQHRPHGLPLGLAREVRRRGPGRRLPGGRGRGGTGDSRSRSRSSGRRRFGWWTPTAAARRRSRERFGPPGRGWTRPRSGAWRMRRRERGAWSTALRSAWTATRGHRFRVR